MEKVKVYKVEMVAYVIANNPLHAKKCAEKRYGKIVTEVKLDIDAVPKTIVKTKDS